MKKIAILLVFTLGTFIVNAQSVVEGTKFMDNWSVGVNAGAVTPLTHTVLSFKTIPIILVILRKTIIFAHSDA